MAVITATLNKVAPNTGFVAGVASVNPSDSGDTFTVTLSTLGISTFRGIFGMVETTAGSVSVTEAPTTSVSAGVLTVTVGGSSVTNKSRTYIIYGSS